MITIKGFLTNLADYNNGMLNGKWLNFPMSEEEIEEVFEELGIDEAHEYFFTDWETDCGHFEEFENIYHVNELAENLEDVDEKHFLAYQEVNDEALETAIDNYKNSIFYSDVTLSEIARDMIAGYDLPEFVLDYFDFEAYENNLEYDGYHETSYGVICI